MSISKNRKVAFGIGGFIVLILVVFYAMNRGPRGVEAGKIAFTAGDNYLTERNYPRAIEKFQEGLRLAPSVPEAKDYELVMASTMARAGREDEALTVMRKLAQENDRIGKGAQKVLRNPRWPWRGVKTREGAQDR